MKKNKIIRISTVPQSLNGFLKGQFKMLSEYYDVVAVSSPGSDLIELEERENVRTIAISMERRISLVKDLISLFKLIRLFHKEKPYAVHSMTPKAGILSMLAAWITRVPVRIHTFTGLVFPTSTGIKKKILMVADKITCKCCTYINPEGQGVKNDLLRYHITNKPLHIIANGNVRGVRMDFYDRTKEVLYKAKEIRNNDKITFCFVGRLVKDKGIDELVNAFNSLTELYSNIRLILVGPYEEKLDPLEKNTLNIINNNKNISAVGSQDDIRPFLAASDIFVFPSYREGFPNVVLEAGAMGLPSIVTDINGSNEIIIQGENGEIIPSKDEKALFNKMKEWIENPKKVSTMAANSRKMVAERYEQKIIWNALLAEYRNIIG